MLVSNHEHLAAVKGGMGKLSRYQEKNPGVKLDLRGAMLDGSDLSNMNLAGANLSGASLVGSNLANANLRGALLYGARVMDAKFDSATLNQPAQMWASCEGLHTAWGLPPGIVADAEATHPRI